MSDNGLVTVTINGRTVQSEPGRLLIDVAEEMGVFVPRFCYHPGMKSVAVCRMCLVRVEGQGKLLPACATPVAEGMQVNTVEEQAVDAQRGMLEFLLINHPLDCPICDRAGECPLQDQTYQHGPGSSRYVEPKRTYEKALEISELVVLDRERCVLCWRCVRFSDEIAGDQFIQLVDRGPGTQILTFNDEPFDSYFSGNTIQICPVGALTSKPYRFVSRPWNLETAPSVCAYCSVGCPISNERRDDKLVRCQALPNEAVNDFWICDKGRFGYHYVDAEDRLTTPLIRNDAQEFEQASWGEALKRVAEKLRGGEKVGVIAGGHLTTEDAFAVARLARKVVKTPNVDSRIQDEGAPYELALELGGVAGSTATLNDLDAARTIVWAGPDPKETLPVLYLRLRRAVLDNRAKLVVVSPRRISLDSFATHVVRTEAGQEAAALAALQSDPQHDAASDLGAPFVGCWGPAYPGRDERATFRALVDLVGARGGSLLVCPPHAGSQGLIDMGVHPALEPGYKVAGTAGKDTRAMLEAAAAGELDALLIVGADPISDFPDSDLATRALESSAFTVVVELFPTATVKRADVVLPSVAYAERAGTFTNLERRLQRLDPVVPRRGSTREPWSICAALAGELGEDWGWTDFDSVWADIRKEVGTHKDVDVESLRREVLTPGPHYESGFGEPTSGAAVAGPGGRYPKGFRSGAPFQTGQNWPLSWELRAFEAREHPGIIAAAPGDPVEVPESVAAPGPTGATDGSLALYTGRLIYDDGAMVRRSAALKRLAARPFVELNDVDAKELEIADGDDVAVTAGGREVTLTAVVGDVAQGVAFVPYDQPGLRANQLMSGLDARVTVRRA
ncbi:MAG TPA: NADH-quinone oxidoreductase subunit NuoG [Actinomycetota bacterium]